MMIMDWPQAQDEARCRTVWKGASLEERRNLCCLQSDTAVLYLSSLRWLLMRQSEELGSEQHGEALHEDAQWKKMRLHDAEWRLTPPLLLRFSEGFCTQDDAVDFMIDKAADSMEDWLQILSQSARGVVQLTRDHLDEGLQRLAREVYTIMLACIIVHVKRYDYRIRTSLGNVVTALKRPREINLRSWPSKKAMGDLTATWATLSMNDRIKASGLAPAVYWFIQACDKVVSSSLQYCYERKGLGPCQEVLLAARERTELLSRLDVDVGCVLRLSPELAGSPRCLSLLHRLSLKTAVEKEILLRIATGEGYQSVVLSDETYVSKGGPRTWEDIERILATLFLAGLLQNVEQLECHRKLHRTEEAGVHEALEVKKESSRKRKKIRALEQRSICQIERRDGQGGERVEDPGLLVSGRELGSLKELLEKLPREPVLMWRIKNTFVEVVDLFEEKKQFFSRDW